MSSTRLGTVSSVNAAKGTARVTFSDRSNVVSPELNVMKNAWPIAPGERVVCLFLPTGNAGFVLGAYHSADDPPSAGGE